jgi:hypothetical protein|uniref:Major vault protein-like protein n=1 Tax=Caudovirales sp. ctTqA28 TaxID=2826775 RepID=A0A8S5MD73_9CAUD|nr:MAG TPA: major vault protein-like protein [Caudovirales sp. ctTqA28]
MSNDGTMKAVYFVRHRKTGEVRFVKLGARYNQQEWDLVAPVEVPQELKQSS